MILFQGDVKSIAVDMQIEMRLAILIADSSNERVFVREMVP